MYILTLKGKIHFKLWEKITPDSQSPRRIDFVVDCTTSENSMIRTVAWNLIYKISQNSKLCSMLLQDTPILKILYDEIYKLNDPKTISDPQKRNSQSMELKTLVSIWKNMCRVPSHHSELLQHLDAITYLLKCREPKDEIPLGLVGDGISSLLLSTIVMEKLNKEQKKKLFQIVYRMMNTKVPEIKKVGYLCCDILLHGGNEIQQKQLRKFLDRWQLWNRFSNILVYPVVGLFQETNLKIDYYHIGTVYGFVRYLVHAGLMPVRLNFHLIMRRAFKNGNVMIPLGILTALYSYMTSNWNKKVIHLEKLMSR